MTRLATIQSFGPTTVRRIPLSRWHEAECEHEACRESFWVRGTAAICEQMARRHWRNVHPNYPIREPWEAGR